MGILFSTSTWRAPLLIIDSWLPQRSAVPARRTPPQVLQRFARAGWLGRHGPLRSATPKPLGERAGAHLAVTRTSAAVRRGGSAEPWGADSRIVIAGRMRDVCAELDRLVAMEQKQLATGI
jgi:hypothetical protein